MKFCVALIALTLTCVSLGGCAAPRLCPPGSHPGPYGHRCFLNG